MKSIRRWGLAGAIVSLLGLTAAVGSLPASRPSVRPDVASVIVGNPASLSIARLSTPRVQGPGAADAQDIENPLSLRRNLAGRLGRLAVYFALFITVGAIGTSLFVVPRLRRARFEEGDALPTVLDGMALSVGVVGGFLLALAILIRTLLQYSDSQEADVALTLTAFLFENGIGRGLATSTLLGVVVAVSSALARSHRTIPFWRLVQIVGVVLFVHFWASSGHSSAAAPLFGLPAGMILIVHVLSAGLWIGMPAVMFVTALPVALRDSARIPLLRATILSFSGVAVVSAAVTVLTGVLNGMIHVGTVSGLTNTPYGRTLLLKVALVLLLLGVGAYNWRRVRPRLHSIADAVRLRGMIRLELLLAAIILIVTAVLVVTTPPA